MRSLDCFNLTQSFQPQYGLGFGSAPNRNEHQEFSWRVKLGQRVRLITTPSYKIRISRICRILDVSQPYGPQRPVRGIALFFKWGSCSFVIVTIKAYNCILFCISSILFTSITYFRNSYFIITHPIFLGSHMVSSLWRQFWEHILLEHILFLSSVHYFTNFSYLTFTRYIH
jgi:hypothetical protein